MSTPPPLPPRAFHQQFAVLAAAGFLLVSAVAFYLYQLVNRLSCCDATGYSELAGLATSGGLDAAAGNIRTWAYPWFLATVGKVANVLTLPPPVLTLLVQAGLYFAAAFVLAKRLFDSNQSAGVAAFVLLCANIFVHPYLGVTLTDGLYTALVLLVYWALVRLSAEGAAAPVLSRNLFWLVYLCTFALVVRPAAVWMIAPVVLVLLHLFLKRRLRPASFLAILLGCAPLLVQLHQNALAFQAYSFMPVVPLGDSQLVWGVTYLKYATYLGEGGPRNIYPSGYAVASATEAIQWYLADGWRAVSHLFIKLIGAFDFDYILPYPARPQGLGVTLALGLISYSVVFLGAHGAVSHALTGRHPALGPRYLPISMFVSWGALTLVSAIELRFSLPALCLGLIISPFVVQDLKRASRTRKLLTLALYIVFMAVAFSAAAYVRSRAMIQ